MLSVALLRKYGPVAASLLLITGLYALHSNAVDKADQAGYQRATDEMNARVILANEKARNAEKQAQTRANEVDREHAQAIADLDARYAGVRLAVRVCPPAASSPRVPTATPTAGGDNDPTERADIPGRAAPDIGPSLLAMARRADDYRQRLIACQGFLRTQR